MKPQPTRFLDALVASVMAAGPVTSLDPVALALAIGARGAHHRRDRRPSGPHRRADGRHRRRVGAGGLPDDRRDAGAADADGGALVRGATGEERAMITGRIGGHAPVCSDLAVASSLPAPLTRARGRPGRRGHRSHIPAPQRRAPSPSIPPPRRSRGSSRAFRGRTPCRSPHPLGQSCSGRARSSSAATCWARIRAVGCAVRSARTDRLNDKVSAATASIISTIIPLPRIAPERCTR